MSPVHAGMLIGLMIPVHAGMLTGFLSPIHTGVLIGLDPVQVTTAAVTS